MVCRMLTFSSHIAMMMSMEMPSPGHFVMPRELDGHAETGRIQ